MRDPGDNVSHLKVVLYGPSGTGKTTISSTFQKPLLHIDINENTDRVLKDVDGIKTISVDNTSLFEDLYWWVKENPDEYKTIVIDTISQLQEIVHQEYSDTLKQPSIGRPMMNRQGWGFISGEMKVNIKRWCNLGIDIVFIAQNRSFNEDIPNIDDTEIQPEIGPSLMPSVAKFLNASVDVLGSTFIQEKVIRRKRKIKGKIKITTKTVKNYSVRLGTHAVYTVKVRNQKHIVVPESITDPTYDKLIDVIEGNYNG